LVIGLVTSANASPLITAAVAVSIAATMAASPSAPEPKIGTGMTGSASANAPATSSGLATGAIGTLAPSARARACRTCGSP
jgi:hypothetical protein